MSKPQKKQGNPDFRHRVTCPAPTSQEIESRLLELVTPGTFANLKGVKEKERSLRDRLLTLPMMTAIVLSLVYRQIHYLTDVLRCLEVEGVGRGNISKSASVISTPRELACSVVYQTPGYATQNPQLQLITKVG
ncbi:hypothetical protein [Nostoc sp.]|uniref:hypothetical protein n=1 Tax=Nostoc sp. TaxID=1180 RepID=UPI002FF59768